MKSILACVIVLTGLWASGDSAAANGNADRKSGGIADDKKDCPVCPAMVKVPTGTFRMGSPADEPGRDKTEGPVPYRIRIDHQLWMGKYEITYGEYLAFLSDIGRRGREDRPWFKTKSEDPDSRIMKRGNRYVIESGYDRHPIMNVSWYGAKAYTDWLRRKTDRPYRLPTEAEWEYVARAGTTTPFTTGQHITTDQANFDGNYTYNGSSKGTHRGKTTPVGTFKPNDFGLYDMHGNVREWTADCYDRAAYKTHDAYPKMVGKWRDSCLRAFRGGAWYYVPRYLRSAVRSRSTADNRNKGFGFRVAQSDFTP